MHGRLGRGWYCKFGVRGGLERSEISLQFGCFSCYFYEMLEKISRLFEDFLILITQCAFWLYLLGLMLLAFAGFAFPLASQALEWLQNGVVSPRDGFWLYALYDCGEEWCRPVFVNPTEWVGVNRIANWIMDLHVAIYCVVFGWFGYGLALAWAETIGGWKEREARLRAPPLLPDPDDAD